MRLEQLYIENLRIIREASVDTGASLVVLVGGNASGKTTFLEGISTLLSGRSFRTRHGSQLINAESEGYLVRGISQSECVESKDQRVATELKRKQSPRFRIGAEDVRPSQLARNFPVQIIDASIFDLIEGSPVERRRFVDWGMFHVKHDFYPLWKKHRKLVSHWNALLRDGAKPSDFEYWKPGFVEASEKLAAIREAYVRELSELMTIPDDQQIALDFFGGHVALGFNRGWSADSDYGQFLEDSLPKDLRERRLRSGAQYFDLRMTIDGKPVKEIFSRGQKKLFGLKLKLAQIKLYNSLPNRPSCVVLVDDLAAEVDLANQQLAIKEILAAGSQVFLTAVDRTQLEAAIPENTDTKMFHVKQGVIKELH